MYLFDKHDIEFAAASAGFSKIVLGYFNVLLYYCMQHVHPSYLNPSKCEVHNIFKSWLCVL